MTMQVLQSRAARVLLILAVTALGGCKDDPLSPVLQGNGPVPDFSVEDVNPNSARDGELVSPRDYLGEVSAWYFGHAT